MRIKTNKGRVVKVKAIYPIEQVEYEIGDEKKHAFAHASSITKANGLFFWLDTPSIWVQPYLLVGNLQNDILQKIIDTVGDGRVYDFTKQICQSAKELKDISLSSSLPWSSENTFIPIGVQEQLTIVPGPVLKISSVEFMNPPIICGDAEDEGGDFDAEE